MKEEVNDFIEAWNNFIYSIIQAKESWQKFGEIKEEAELSLEDFPDGCQKVLARADIKAKFLVGVVRFLSYTEQFSSMEDCYIEKEANEGVENG